MDVTFFETTPYIHKTALQGENLGEYQFLEFLGSERPTLTSSSTLESLDDMFLTPHDIEFLASPSVNPNQPTS